MELCKRLEQKHLVTLGTYHTRRPPSSRIILPPKGMDLSVDADLDRLLAFVQQYFGGPFAVAHCVGDFWEHLPVSMCSLELARRMITSHYLTLYGVLHRLLPYMADVGGGRILALSCTSTNFSYPDMAAFTSAKAALEMLIKCVANEWAPRGITANAIALNGRHDQSSEIALQANEQARILRDARGGSGANRTSALSSVSLFE